jgi:tetratricopeptide (TPR) repeat protein
MKVSLLIPLAACVLAAAPARPCATAEGCFGQGLRLFVQEDYKQAAEAFEKALDKGPGNPDYLVWLGRAYGRRAERMSGLAKLGAFGLARRVRQSFEQALQADSRHLPALESLLEFFVEAPGAVGGGKEKAPPLAERIAAIDAARGQRAWAKIHQARGETAEAEAALRRAVELEPGNTGHLTSLASFLARQGRFEESDRIYEELFRLDPESPALWFSRAKELVRAGRHPREARRLLERYLESGLPEPSAEPHSEARRLLRQL